MSDLITNNLDFGTGDNYVLQDARVDSMYTNAQIDSAMGNKVDKVSGKGLSTNDYTTAEKTKLTNLTQPNNATITIRQGGVVKGTFTVDSSQDVTIDIDAGGSQIDAYTKTESDNRFASKSIYGDSSIEIDSSDYSIAVGYNNTFSDFGRGVIIGANNNVNDYASQYRIIGNNNNMLLNSNNNILIGNSIMTGLIDDYEVLIGYNSYAMSVKPNGEVYSRGDVSCDDGSGNRIGLRAIKASIDNVQNLSFNPETANVTLTTGANIAKKWGHIVFIDFDFTPKANFAKFNSILSILGVTTSMMSHFLIKSYATDEIVGTGLLLTNPNFNDRIMLRNDVALSANVRYRGSAFIFVD